MFSFFNHFKPVKSADLLLSAVQVDWHCHILPGIDDGAKNLDESLGMLEAYVRLGIQKIVATPHIHGDFFPNNRQTIALAHQQVAELISRHQLPLTLEYAAEYYADEHFRQLIANNDLLPIDEQYILFEWPMQQLPLSAQLMVEQIQKKGFVPVLAHPERYRYWHGKIRDLGEWKRMGVYFQLNLLSLTGHYGRSEKQMAQQLLDADYIDAVGTDAHGLRHLQKLEQLGNDPYFEQLQQIPLLNRLG
jgi:protein-tyrosine phosphatase